MGYFIKNLETGKIELYFKKEEYLGLDKETKTEIKSRFLFSRKSGAWVSRGKYPNYSYREAERFAKENLKLDFEGEEGEKLSFKEQQEKKREKAESRAEYYEQKAIKTSEKGKNLQKPIEDMRGDIAFFTQPNINNSSGRAFTNKRNKMWSSWEKGWEEYKKSEYYMKKSEIAKETSEKAKLPNIPFCNRRIEECEASIRKLKKEILECDGYIKSLEKGETPKNKYGWEVKTTKEKCLSNIKYYETRLEEEIDKASYYYECIDKQGGITFSKENLQVGDIIKYKNNLGQIVSLGKKNVTYYNILEGWGFLWKFKVPYCEIEKVTKKATEIKHDFNCGDKLKNIKNEIYEVSKTSNSQVWLKKNGGRAKAYTPVEINGEHKIIVGFDELLNRVTN